MDRNNRPRGRKKRDRRRYGRSQARRDQAHLPPDRYIQSELSDTGILKNQAPPQIRGRLHNNRQTL